jgi:hypothetical protein
MYIGILTHGPNKYAEIDPSCCHQVAETSDFAPDDPAIVE